MLAKKIMLAKKMLAKMPMSENISEKREDGFKMLKCLPLQFDCRKT